MRLLGWRESVKWILRNTIVTNESITPELNLRLITTASPLWMSTPDACPLLDPYWAFYWPGGQALTRFILDNRLMFKKSTVLDFGAGCGSSSVAATICQANRVLVNDIDKSDMFYDSDFAAQMFRWLKRLQTQHGIRVFVGDPDRHPLSEQRCLDSYDTKFTKKLIVEYSLPGYVIKEHYGFNTAKVFEIVLV